MRNLDFEDSIGIKFQFLDGVLTIDATNLKKGALPRLFAQTDQNNQYTDEWKFLQENTECVVIKGNISEMSYPVFQHFVKLSYLHLPESLESLCFDFDGCTNLNKITLRAKTKIFALGNNYFRSIEVDEDNPYYTSVNGYLMSKDGKTLIVAPGGLDELIIPEGCEKIGQESIYMSYKKIVIPSSASSIHEWNFYGDCGTIVLGDFDKQYELIKKCFTRNDGFKAEYQERFNRINLVR